MVVHRIFLLLEIQKKSITGTEATNLILSQGCRQLPSTYEFVFLKSDTHGSHGYPDTLVICGFIIVFPVEMAMVMPRFQTHPAGFPHVPPRRLSWQLTHRWFMGIPMAGLGA